MHLAIVLIGIGESEEAVESEHVAALQVLQLLVVNRCLVL